MVAYISSLSRTPSPLPLITFDLPLNTHPPCPQVSPMSLPPSPHSSSSICQRRRSTASAKSRSSLVSFGLVPRRVDLTILHRPYRYHRSRWFIPVSNDPRRSSFITVYCIRWAKRQMFSWAKGTERVSKTFCGRVKQRRVQHLCLHSPCHLGVFK